MHASNWHSGCIEIFDRVSNEKLNSVENDLLPITSYLESRTCNSSMAWMFIILHSGFILWIVFLIFFFAYKLNDYTIINNCFKTDNWWIQQHINRTTTITGRLNILNEVFFTVSLSYILYKDAVTYDWTKINCWH